MNNGTVDAKRFWQKVGVGSPSDCWDWQAKKDRDGYGVHRVNNRDHRAHRVAYELRTGIAPRVVRHLCDNRACCNPSHLRDGSQGQNIADRDWKNRQAKGSSNGRSKLTEQDVYLIKRYLFFGKVIQAEVAREFGVDRSVVRDIKFGKTWRHVRFWEEAKGGARLRGVLYWGLGRAGTLALPERGAQPRVPFLSLADVQEPR